jgi:hypothetical protein
MNAWARVLPIGSTLPPAVQSVTFGGHATALTAADSGLLAE